jgi:hypothetical protein
MVSKESLLLSISHRTQMANRYRQELADLLRAQALNNKKLTEYRANYSLRTGEGW